MFFGWWRRVRASASGDGAVVVAGDNSGSINTNVFHLSTPSGAVAARPVYVEQVRRIAPPQLLGREDELAELAAFCRGSGQHSYVWWRADAWAGKSALLSTFVLRPPARLSATGVRIISFFITGRMAGADTREAFTAAVLHQLCVLTGQKVPPLTDEGIREAWMLHLLREAARHQRRRGGRLILIVDGLDEERGVSLGPNISSIAGLLPADPPHSMRIIVASRPNPPLPGDVPGSHPLRDPRIVRGLGASPHARDTETQSKAELRRLLDGSDIEQQLLGLLTASRGGLSQADLRQLTGADLLAIEDALHTVGGRTFTHRADVWSADVGKIYLLGHEELHRAAVEYLGADNLAAYRRRLQAWADSWSLGPWTRETPEYLLRDYPRMLAEIGDTERLVALATDAARQDRMLDLSGGDHAVLAEIRTAEELVLGKPELDLVALARLARHRDELAVRNAAVPANLPALWAALDNPIRAESLARSLPRRDRQVEAFAAMARVRVAVGDITGAVTWVADAAELALSETDPVSRARCSAQVTGAMAATGDRAAKQWAEATRQAAIELAENGNPYAAADVAQALAAAGAHKQATLIAAALTGSLKAETAERIARTRTAVEGTVFTGSTRTDPHASAVAAGDATRAEQVASAIRDPAERAQALAGLGLAAASARDPEHARSLAVLAEATARHASGRYLRAYQLLDVARAVAVAGDVARAERIVRSLDDPDQRIKGLHSIAVAAADRPDNAQTLALSIPGTYQQAVTMAAVAEAVAATGDRDRAAKLARLAERVAHDIPAAAQRAQALTAAARATVVAGDPVHAENITRAVPDSADRVNALVGLAAVSAPDRALALALSAHDAARTITSLNRRTRANVAVAAALIDAGDTTRGRKLASEAAETVRSGALGSRTESLLLDIARTFIAAGDHQNALRVMSTATVRMDIARSLTKAGQYDRAEQLIESVRHIPLRYRRNTAYVAAVMAAAGEFERAESLARRGEESSGGLDTALAEVAMAVASHDPVRAEALATTIDSPDQRARACVRIAEVLGLPAGTPLFAQALALGSWPALLPTLATLLPDAVLMITEDF